MRNVPRTRVVVYGLIVGFLAFLGYRMLRPMNIQTRLLSLVVDGKTCGLRYGWGSV